jgi:hypothetical protein
VSVIYVSGHDMLLCHMTQWIKRIRQTSTTSNTQSTQLLDALDEPERHTAKHEGTGTERDVGAEDPPLSLPLSLSLSLSLSLWQTILDCADVISEVSIELSDIVGSVFEELGRAIRVMLVQGWTQGVYPARGDDVVWVIDGSSLSDNVQQHDRGVSSGQVVYLPSAQMVSQQLRSVGYKSFCLSANPITSPMLAEENVGSLSVVVCVNENDLVRPSDGEDCYGLLGVCVDLQSSGWSVCILVDGRSAEEVNNEINRIKVEKKRRADCAIGREGEGAGELSGDISIGRTTDPVSTILPPPLPPSLPVALVPPIHVISREEAAESMFQYIRGEMQNRAGREREDTAKQVRVVGELTSSTPLMEILFII